ncbi:glycosyltransferase family 2 protein [Grimontia hollisae]|uniref:glycosyltransferase family 2 protein n=1 Tax=Grimontia hollisae TaxID=673 RepID=UPI001303D0A1|nr:glycosyltransferase family 2 protein [Grimontia hollisae]MDF2186401.1 glycosyltransferase family 2 protein [Grimontia hollisae]
MLFTAVHHHCIDVVLATYNGEKYIEEQIKSVQRNDGYQFLVNSIIVVDDGSSDNTVSIVKRLAINDSKIRIYINESSSLGAMKNFASGVYISQANFIMFCDQDDVWLENKISLTLESMIKHDATLPHLVFSDLKIVDASLNVISDSYFTAKKIPKNWHADMNNLVKQNVVSGCTMMANRALLQKALPIPNEACMHDWWFALVAKTEGKLTFVDQALMLYRQHETNAIGAGDKNPLGLFKRIYRFRQNASNSVKQAGALSARYPYLASQYPSVAALSQQATRSRLRNTYAALFGELRRSSFQGSAAMALYCLFFSG